MPGLIAETMTETVTETVTEAMTEEVIWAEFTFRLSTQFITDFVTLVAESASASIAPHPFDGAAAESVPQPDKSSSPCAS